MAGSYTLELEVFGLFTTNAPSLEIWEDGVLDSTHLVSSSGTTISVTINYGGALPASLVFTFNDGFAANGRTIEIRSVKINDEYVNVGNYLDTDSLTKSASANVDVTSSDFLFDPSDPAASEFTTGATQVFTAGADTFRDFRGTSAEIFDMLGGRDVVYLGSGDDKVAGGAGNDVIYSGAGNDLISGGADNDRIYGGAGADELYGGTGNDRIHGGTGDDGIHGGDGDDRLNGHADNDTITGGAGADKLSGGSGNDILYGGADNDQLIGGTGNDTLDGGIGDDVVFGGSGVDHINGGDGIDILIGGTGDDTIHGDAGDDTIYGGADNDTIYGGDDNDYINGGTGADIIDGGAGNDILVGNTAQVVTVDATTLLSYGGSQDGTTTITYFTGGVELDGNPWKKILVDYTITANTVIEFDFLSTVEGDIHGIGFDNDDNINNSTATFKLYGTQSWNRDIHDFENYDGSGDWNHYKIDVGSYYTGTFSHLTIVGDDDSNPRGNGSWSNIIIYESTAPADIDIVDGGAGADQIFGENGDDTLSGGAGDDVISGNDGIDTLYGDAGDDTIHGGSGNDIIDGGADNDELYGDDGNDTIDGGAGNDFINGGAGTDTAVFAGNWSDYTITLAGSTYTIIDNVGTDGTDTAIRVENFEFADGTLSSTTLLEPTITSNGGGVTASVSIAENGTAVTTAIATNPNLGGGALTYSITGGADSALFTIDGATGILTFTSAPDYESPSDSGANNIYDIEITASDGVHTDEQSISVSITDVGEGDVGSTPGTAGTLAIGGSVIYDVSTGGTGGDHDWFAVSLTSGTDYAFWARGTPTEAGTATDPRIFNLYEADGTTSVGADDDSGIGYESLLTYTATYTGTYYIDAGTGGGAGNITLSAYVNGGRQVTGGGAQTLTGTANADYLESGDGNDTLNGLGGSDILWGENNDDILDGGADADVLYGGSGADTFLFNHTDASDSIVDFTTADGDVLDISNILIGWNAGTDDIDDYVQFQEVGGNTIMRVDVDGLVGGTNFVEVAVLEGNTGEIVQTLYDNGDIIA